MSEVRFSERRRGPVLSNDSLRLTVRLEDGTFSVGEAATGRAVLPRVSTSVVFVDGSSLSTRGAGFRFEGARRVDDAQGSGRALILRRRRASHEPDLTLSLTLYDRQPFAVLRSEVTNTTAGPLRVRAFHVVEGGPLRLGPDSKAWRFYKEGWQNWTPALVLPCSGEDIYMAPPVIGPTTQPPSRRGRFLSELVTAVVDPATNRGLTAGFISTADQFSQVWLDRGRRALTAASYADGIEVPSGGSLASERLLLEPTRSPLESLQRYGDALARQMGAVPWPHVVTGWCSWYYYWQGIREETILANLDYLAEHRDELPVEYVQIDDGYQAGIGDWLTTNDKFPHGMGWLAEQIHERGFKAGLWLAPFMMGADSRLWRDHADWAVQYPSAEVRTGKRGRPYVAMVNWSQECYAMDLTHPDVIEWLDHAFNTVFHDWRYDYIKIDFLYAGAVDGIRHDPNVSRAQAYRRGLETIRKAAGGRFILGCGNPVAPSTGIVNGMRIGPDVAPFWYPAEPPRERGRSELSLVSAVNGIRNVLARYWMHRRLWLNDPDCLLARDSETALTLDEVRTLATVIGLSRGMMLDSDNLPRLSEERRQIVSFLLPPYGGSSAVPLDLFESEMPRLFELDCGSHRLLGVFNWQDAPAEVTAPLPAQPTHAFEAWGREYLGVRQDELVLSLPRHGCALLSLHLALERPQLVGSTFHLAQGALEVEAEQWQGDTLGLSLRPVACKRGELFVHAPAAWGDPSLEPLGGARLDRRPDGLLALELTLDRPLELRLRFPRT